MAVSLVLNKGRVCYGEDWISLCSLVLALFLGLSNPLSLYSFAFSGRENQELQTVASVWVFGSLWLM
uniref:Uncharacterized protein n=1 Tax=Fagus sylvatica TaxID=28930 RepID=A0A2N9FHZ2_FAGSY